MATTSELRPVHGLFQLSQKWRGHEGKDRGGEREGERGMGWPQFGKNPHSPVIIIMAFARDLSPLRQRTDVRIIIAASSKNRR